MSPVLSPGPTPTRPGRWPDEGAPKGSVRGPPVRRRPDPPRPTRWLRLWHRYLSSHLKGFLFDRVVTGPSRNPFRPPTPYRRGPVNHNGVLDDDLHLGSAGPAAGERPEPCASVHHPSPRDPVPRVNVSSGPLRRGTSSVSACSLLIRKNWNKIIIPYNCN